jgi:hypothetical protein
MLLVLAVLGLAACGGGGSTGQGGQRTTTQGVVDSGAVEQGVLNAFSSQSALWTVHCDHATGEQWTCDVRTDTGRHFTETACVLPGGQVKVAEDLNIYPPTHC